MNAAAAVVVIWSRESVESNWVKSEAQHAYRQNKLIPVRLPDCQIELIPKPYSVLHIEIVSNRRAILAAIATQRLLSQPPGPLEYLGSADSLKYRSAEHLSVLGMAQSKELIANWNTYLTSFPLGPSANTIAEKLAQRIARNRLIASCNMLKGISAVSFTSDGSHAICGSRDGKVSLVSVFSGGGEPLQGQHARSISLLLMSPDGRIFVSVDDRGQMMFWDLAERRSIFAARTQMLSWFFPPSPYVDGCFCGPRVFALVNRTASIWGLETTSGNQLRISDISRVARPRISFDSATFGAGGEHLLILKNGMLQLIRLDSLGEYTSTRLHKTIERPAAISLSSDCGLGHRLIKPHPDADCSQLH